MGKYAACPKCKKLAVHLVMDTGVEFYGDGDDQNGNPSVYDGEHPPFNEDAQVCIFAHACFECGHLIDVGIESPRDRALNTAE